MLNRVIYQNPVSLDASILKTHELFITNHIVFCVFLVKNVMMEI